jgi:hypothetical protein
MAPWATEKYTTVLSGFQQRYKDCKSGKKGDVIGEVVKEITALAEKDGVAIPANLEKVSFYAKLTLYLVMLICL